MKRNDLYIITSLMISLYIYVFYRTERTLVNEIIIRATSLACYTSLRTVVSAALPLPKSVIFSLPEGLWIFCITLTSSPYYLRIHRWQLECIYIPIVFCVTLEVLQLFHLTNGRFDLMDILVFVSFWFLGLAISDTSLQKEDLLRRPTKKTLFCLASYCIVYLAHVIN